ncbi:tetratricopeptide repeat protein [Nonomuraea sp. NPDC050556]|uniref:tetratricopeptide repeat protein n=1 Tax=Nonomuraea sp. NPDC050556 TaxID=3364369 RepID=UPI0037BC2CE1
MNSGGEALRRRRLAAGWSQHTLATRAGVAVRTLRDIERGRVARPHRASLDRLVAALPLREVDRAELLAAFEADEPVQVAVLGPLSVRRGQVEVDVGAAMPRALLGLLALRSGVAVGTEEIVDVLWEDRPPRTSDNLIQVYATRLRASLGAQTIRRTPGGYLLALDGDALDLAVFDRLSAAGEYLEALALWRGPVLAGSPSRLRDHPVAVATARRRIEAALAFAAACEDGGRAAAALWPVVQDEPLHEGLAARLMTALAAHGEQATALRLYAATRSRLAEELGIEPGAELRRARERIVNRPPEVPVAASARATAVPAQLPAGMATFTGRTASLRRLDRLLSGRGETTDIAVITGTAGVGKTALAVHWAQRALDRFPDGQLYVNLRGYAAARPLTPLDALSRFLHALGVPPEQVPTDQDEAAALYRTMLAGKRVLVLLDNAADAGQLRPLLPGGAGSAALITSRDALAGLVARDGARVLPLTAMTAHESRHLLTRLLGQARVRAEPTAVLDLAALCAHLPLALRIAAANLLGGPGTVGAYAERLRAGNRLDALQVPGDAESAVRTAFQLSYAALPSPARRLFRLLGLIPGPDIGVPGMAALLGAEPGAAAELAAVLRSANLLDEPVPGRFAQHDLLRLCAAEYADGERGELVRLHLHYLDTADAAARTLYPQFLRLDPPRSDALFPDPTTASTWLDTELPNLMAAVTHTAEHGPRELAWKLADVMRGYFFLRHCVAEWRTIGESALGAAQREGSERAQAALLLSLAGLHGFQGRQQQAIEHYQRAMRLSERSGWRDGLVAAMGNAGVTYADLGMLAEAVDHLKGALKLNEELERAPAQTVNLGNLGCLYLEMGRLHDATRCVTQALKICRDLEHPGSEANNLAVLGEVQHGLGRLPEARETLRKALDLHREVGNRGNEADTLRNLAAVERDEGRLALALELATAALDASQQTGHRRLVADTLITLGLIHLRLGAVDAALDHCTRALDLARAAGNRYPETKALLGLAACASARGDHEVAVRHAELALATARAAGYRLHEGLALQLLGEAHAAHQVFDGLGLEAPAVQNAYL